MPVLEGWNVSLDDRKKMDGKTRAVIYYCSTLPLLCSIISLAATILRTFLRLCSHSATMSNFQPQRQPPLEYLPISNNGTAHTSDRLCTTCVSFLMFALYLTMLCDECETSDYGHVKSYQDTNFTAAQCDLCKALIEIEQEKFASRYNCSMTEAHYRLLAMKRKRRPCRMVLVQNCGLVEVRIQTTETLFFTLQFSSGTSNISS